MDVVIPTCGRPSLARLLEALEREGIDGRVRVVDGSRVGPAAARNEGWRASTAEWVVFLDDDVVPAAGWGRALRRDLAGLPEDVGGSQGRIEVPLPAGRRPTDWERNVAGLQTARWATADMAYRRAALAAVGGFDEGFRRAYREDADLGLRVTAAGWRIVRGERRTVHPVRPAGPLVSVRLQAGNEDDVRMRARHGPRWRERAGVPRGRRPLHLVTVGAAALALARVPGARTAWALLTAELAWRRIAPGPRTPREVATMAATSVLLPFAASGWFVLGHARNRRRRLAAVLLDRDGTLVHDVPYNGDPARVEPMPGAAEAIARLRRAGVPTAVVSNQSGIGRGLLTAARVEAVNRRIEELLGPLGPWLVCPHAPGDGCDCRKPRPGLVLAAARALGVDPSRCVVVGDIGADVDAARAAGARAVLVPTRRTRPEEVAAAPEVAPDLAAAVDRVLGARA